MKSISPIAILLAFAGMALAAEPKDEVLSAAKMLGEKNSYSWTSTVNNLTQSRFRSGPTEGKTEKGGFTTVSMSFGDNSLQAVLKGDKGAIRTDEGWKSLSELAANTEGQNPGRFLGRFLQGFRSPAEQAADLANKTYGIRKSDDAYVGDLSQDALKELLTFRRRGGTDNNTPEPMIRDAAGMVKFWVKDGVLTKFEYSAKGMVSFGGGERAVDRVTTVEIKEIDSTKIDVPEEAKQKAS